MPVRERHQVRRLLAAAPFDEHCTDAELLELVERREPQALQELYRRYAPLLFGIARRLGGAGVAEGAVSALFVQIWAAPASFSPDAGSLRRVLLARTVCAALAAPPAPEERAWALLTIGEYTFAEAAQLLGEPEATIRQYALAAFRARSTAQSPETREAG